MDVPVSPTAGLRPHPSNWTNEPEKANTHCLYCNQPVPNHADDCVCIERIVILEYKVQYAQIVPRSWTIKDINFKYQESSSCTGHNELAYLYEKVLASEEEGLCSLCSRTEVKYVREATEEDRDEFIEIEPIMTGKFE